MNIEQLYRLYTKNYLVATDTRNIKTGSIFFGLKGKNFNGNKFAKQALLNGADYAIVDDEAYCTNENILLVEDVLITLQELSKFHRQQLKIPIIALTGSNGKTTTKELINSVLSQKFKTKATAGNLNNHIGVPLTILSIDPSIEIAVIEMGANHLGEIEFLCNLANPNYGLITNFGKAHLEGFGSFEGVIKGKSELYNYLRKSKGKAFVNEGDELQLKQSEGIECIYYNSKLIPLLENSPFVKIGFENIKIESNLIGKYNYNNIATAIAVGNYFKVENSLIKKAVETYIPANNRSQLIEKGSNKIILDAYNANPTSMTAALENFRLLNEKCKIVILGDMFELGSESKVEHKKITEIVENCGFTKVYLIGKAFSTMPVKNAFVYESFEQLKNSNNLKIQHCHILIKGSRGMALERVLDLL